MKNDLKKKIVWLYKKKKKITKKFSTYQLYVFSTIK